MKPTSIRLSEKTQQQLEDLKMYYSNPETMGVELNYSQIIKICVNRFWQHYFIEEEPDNILPDRKEENRTNGFLLDEE